MKYFLFLILFAAGWGLNGRSQEIFEKLTEQKLNACTPVKDQYMSGTCWSFASVSLFESDLLRRGRAAEDISEIFIARYSYIRKIILHLRQKGGNYFTPGGQFHDVMWVMRNYGLAPEAAYSGLAGGANKHHHALLDTAMKRYIEQLVKKGVTAPGAAHWKYINSLLDKHLGKPPARFIYKDKAYTPKTYMTNYLGIQPDDYIELTSYSHHPWYSRYVLEDKYNWSGETYFNLPFADLKETIANALHNGHTVLWSGEVQDTGFRYQEGYAALKDTTGHLAAFRQQSFMDKTTEQDHLMHVVGVYTDEAGRRWYRLKNSWGDYSNNNGGFLYMNEDYFFTKGVNFTVNKNAIPAHIREKIN